jgi:hypothetical protein
MKKTTKLIAPTLALAIMISAGAYGISQANGGYGAGRENLIEKFSKQFNLNQNEVKQIFEKNREEMQAQRQAEIEKRLSEAVSTGEITENQKNLILEKKKEMREYMQNNWEEFRKLSREDRQEKMQERHSEIEKWAADNEIPEKYLFSYGNGRGMGLHRS